MFLDLFLPEDIYSLVRLQEKLTEKRCRYLNSVCILVCLKNYYVYFQYAIVVSGLQWALTIFIN